MASIVSSMSKDTKPPSRTADQFVVRLPNGMRDLIAESAHAAGRSMNAEIVHRLENSFSKEQRRLATDELVASLVPPDYLARMKKSAEERGIPLFAELLVRLEMFENFMATEGALNDFSARLARSFASQLSVEEFTKLRNEVFHGPAAATAEKKKSALPPAKSGRKLKIDQ